MWYKLTSNILIVVFTISGLFTLNAQVGIGTDNPDPSSVLDVFSNEKGMLIPRLTNEQRDAIASPAQGLKIFNTSSGCYNYYFGNNWMEVCGRVIGKILILNCSGSTNNGVLTAGSPAINVNSVILYSGGNGGYHNGQTVTSTGVTGLTATLAAGQFANGSGTLTYNISGTPTTSGTASFALNIGGQMCTLSRNVNPAPAYPIGTVQCTITPTAVVEVFNPTTGKIWMDRNLGASQVATSSTDANSYGDLYQWGRRADGHQCRNATVTSTLSNNDQPIHGNFILAPNTPYDWRSPQNANLWQGVNGVNNPCPSGYRLPTEMELNSERLSWGSNNAAGAFSSPLKFSLPGFRYHVNGSILEVGFGGNYWSSTINGTQNSSRLGFSQSIAEMAAVFRAYALSVRCIKDALPVFNGMIQMLDCNNAAHYGTLTSGIPASGVTSTVTYSGGNGGYHNGQTVSSTGVAGLTATLTAGQFVNGSGTLTYTISGTPTTSGTASFALSIGGQMCNLTRLVNAYITYPSGTVHCSVTPTSIVDVLNPTTGKTWMNRNLGASQVATSSTDTNAYGDLYQWGRRADGHQCRNSSTTGILSNSDQPPHGNFILANNIPYDWRSPQNLNLWQGVNGINNPCPNSYRLPTDAELNTERQSWSSNNAAGAFGSPLKLAMAGFRIHHNGQLSDVGNAGLYWSSTVIGVDSRMLLFYNDSAALNNYSRANGLTIRCIKD